MAADTDVAIASNALVLIGSNPFLLLLMTAAALLLPTKSTKM